MLALAALTGLAAPGLASASAATPAGASAPASTQAVSPAGQAPAGSAKATAPVATSGAAAPAATTGIPLAPQIKGDRPKSDPSVLPPAATRLPAALQDLASPASLQLPNRPDQVRIQDLRPLGLTDVETLAEVNNPNLKALVSQVDQAQSNLRSLIALWYPTINLNASNLPAYLAYRNYSSAPFGVGLDPRGISTTNRMNMDAGLQVNWALIDPTRTPQIAAARDQYEKAKNQYLIGLRDLRLQAAQLYFDLQSTDDQVRIGQESVRASLVSLRDAKARYQAGVATKLEVLEAETQLARDEQLLTTNLSAQAIARRSLAALLDLPQNVTPTAKEPSRVVGTWLPSLQQSIVAAYAFREELDQALLDISISNSNANASLGQIQPFLRIINNLGYNQYTGNYTSQLSTTPNDNGWRLTNTIGLNLSWTLYDGGRSQATALRYRQAADENRFRFAQRRDDIRREVEASFYELEKNDMNIATTSREVISSRESLRLARLRFQAGVTTQREVVDNQRDLTNAEVRFANAIADYNKRLADLRRRTGLDQIALCKPPVLPAGKPVITGVSDVPVEPLPVLPACNAVFDADSIPSTIKR